MKEAIPVTQQHINNGKAGHGCQCALALALGDRYTLADVGCFKVWLPTDSFSMSKAVYEWRRAFDNGQRVQAFILILDHKTKTAGMLDEAE